MEIARSCRIFLLSTVVVSVLSIAMSCATGPVAVNPLYATRSNRTIVGEIAIGRVEYPDPRYGSPNSMGAVELAGPVASFCSSAMEQEFAAYGFVIDEKAPLRIDVKILQADTEWRNQGSAGVFSSTFALEYILTDHTGDELYRRIHQGSATHSQSYGGYPASASVVDALATAHERFLADAKFRDILVKTKSVNLYGMATGNDEDRTDYKRVVFKDYQSALAAVSPDLLAYMGAEKFDGIYAIFGFKNRQSARNLLSTEIERELRQILSRERFKVVTRELDAILEERSLQLSGIFDENRRVEIGELEGATHLLTGSLYHYPEDGTIALRIEVVSVENGLAGASFTVNLIATQSYVSMVTTEP